MFLVACYFFPIDFRLKRAADIAIENGPSLWGDRTLGPPFQVRHAEGRGANINLGCQGPFLKAGCVTRVFENRRASGRYPRGHSRFSECDHLRMRVLSWSV